MEKVFVYSQKEEFLCTGILYNREKMDQPIPAAPTAKPKHNYIDLILELHAQQLSAQGKGIDYTKLIHHKRWPFSAFLETLAQLLGQKGGLSTFNAQELENLKKIYDKHSELTEILLLRAFEQAEIKNIAHIAQQLQKLRKE